MNAYTSHEGGCTRIYADVMRYDPVPLFPDVDGTPAINYGPVLLVRWTLDMSDTSGTIKEELLSRVPGEFPAWKTV